MFDFTILLGSLGVRKSEAKAIVVSKGFKIGVIKFTPQITLKTSDGFVELGFDKSMEFGNGGECFRLKI